jgi:hypothetical protein
MDYGRFCNNSSKGQFLFVHGLHSSSGSHTEWYPWLLVILPNQRLYGRIQHEMTLRGLMRNNSATSI